MLDDYLTRWGLSAPESLAQTATSHVYTVMYQGERVVLKVLTDTGAEEQNGAVALECFDGHGAVRVLRHDEGAHLLEYANGEDLVTLVRRGEDATATKIIADVLNQLHSIPPCTSKDKLNSLRRWFRSLFNRAEKDKNAGRNTVFVRCAPLADHLLSHPQDERVLHGDIHHENIRQSARGWLAFDPKGVYGERTYDAANTLLNPITMPELVSDEARLLRNAEILARHLSIPLERVLAFTFAYACLSASWSIEDGENPDLALAVAQMLESRGFP